MKRYAILIGAEKYEEFDDTPFCHNDVDALFNALTKRCDYAEQDVLVFKLTVTDGLSPEGILGKINELLERSKDGDTIFFFYAGHGEAIGNDSYLILPSTKQINKETTALPLRDVAHYLSRNKRVNIRVFDTCHSGQDIRGATDNLNADEFTKRILRNGAQGSITLASCDVHEKSYFDTELRSGIFTHALVRAIEETEIDHEVQPELIKVKVCDKVAQWCLDNNHMQTPTYSAYVNGNISIATRRQEIQPVARQLPNDSRTFEERLLGVRSAAIVAPTEFPMFKEAIDQVREELATRAEKMDFFGTRISFSSPVRCNDAPDFLAQPIVAKLRQEKSLHDIGSYTQDVDQTEFERLLGRRPKKYTYYFLTQSASQPNSFVSGAIETDGYVPTSGVFFYLCPLQASVAAVFGSYFDLAYFGAAEDVTIVGIERETFSLQQIRDREYIRLCRPLLDAFRAALRAKVADRIKHLESETSRASSAPAVS